MRLACITKRIVVLVIIKCCIFVQVMSKMLILYIFIFTMNVRKQKKRENKPCTVQNLMNTSIVILSHMAYYFIYLSETISYYGTKNAC